MMKANNQRIKNVQKAQIVKNKESLFSQHQSQQIWPTHTLPNPLMRSELGLKSNRPVDIQSLLHLFTQHYLVIESFFKEIQSQLTKLESKLADCYGRFNQIEWKLSRQVHQINEAKSLNQSLMLINQEVEQKLAMVRNDYQQLKKRRYLSGMQKKIEQLKQSVHKMELQAYRSKFNKQDIISFEDNLDRLQAILTKPIQAEQSNKVQILQSIMSDLVKLLRNQGNVGTWIQGKIKQNFELKCQILKKECLE